MKGSCRQRKIGGRGRVLRLQCGTDIINKHKVQYVRDGFGLSTSGVIRFCEQPKETKASRRAWSFFKFKYLWGTYDETEPTPELYLLGKHKNSFHLEGIDPQSCICWGNTSIPLRGIDPQSCVSVSCVTNCYVAQELNHTRGGSGGGVDPRICHPALMQTDWVCSRLWLWIFTDDKWSEK